MRLVLKTVMAAIALCAVVLAPFAMAEAASTSKKSSETGAAADPYKAGLEFVKANKFEDAEAEFEKAIKLDPTNADAYNMLAFSLRHNGELDDAFENYEKALALDPDHKGAHEYVGEAYLMVGNLAKAEEHLAALQKLCPSGCEESEDLAKAVQHYKETEKKSSLDRQIW